MVVAALIVTGLYVGRDVLIPIAIAILLSFVLGPLVNLLRKLRLGRFVAVAASVLLTLGIVAALATLIGVQLADLAGDVPRYRSTIERKVESLRDSPAGRMTDYVANIGRSMRQAESEAPKTEAPATETAPNPPPPKPVLVEVREREPSPLETASTVLSPVLHPLATIGIVFIVVLFLLMQREDLRDRMIRLAGSSDLHRTTVAMDDAARRLSRYFLVQLALNAGFGVVVGVGLYFIGVPNPVLWGIFAAVMRFVPYIGAVLSAVFPLALAAAVDPGWSMLIATLILFLVIEPIVGHFIEPMLYGHSTGMSPFAVLVSALFWTWLWGPVGLLLSTPLTVCLVVLGRHVEKLEFLDVLFGNTPALTPVENFYQRILADDPEEAQEHADLLLQKCSLPAYYDDVVLKGLELAARDAVRGVLTADQKNDIRTSIGGLIEEMADREDLPQEGAPAVPPPSDIPAAWREKGAVICVAGRSFVDDAACAILAQLLARRGIGTRVVPFSDLARANIETFEPGPARMICVVSLAISGEPTHVRRLIGRLRRRIPGARIAVGLWQADDAILSDEEQRGAIGADDHIVSFRAAVDMVVAAAAADPTPGPVRSDAPAPVRIDRAVPVGA
jgi:predicted PurR-regulated permease PerM